MAVNYATPLKNDRQQKIIDRLDAQSGFAFLEICSANYALVLAVLILAKPSFILSNGVITLVGVPISAVAGSNSPATNTAALARFKDSAGAVWISGLVCGVGSGDIQLNSLSLTAGQTFTVTSFTDTHSA